MSMVITQTNCKLIPIFIIKKTQNQIIYYCINDNNHTVVLFVNKSININLYEIIYCRIAWHKSNLYTLECIYNKYPFKMLEEINNFLNILCELFWKNKEFKHKGLFEILYWIIKSNEEKKSIYLITKIFLITLRNNSIYTCKEDFMKYENALIFSNYDIIKTLFINSSYTIIKEIYISYNNKLEQNGLELINISKLN